MAWPRGDSVASGRLCGPGGTNGGDQGNHRDLSSPKVRLIQSESEPLHGLFLVLSLSGECLSYNSNNQKVYWIEITGMLFFFPH